MALCGVGHLTVDAVFLSASVPEVGRGEFYETANPFLIQMAVREFLITALGRQLIVWGGHPAITPMVWAACKDLGVSYARSVVLYQSRFFESFFPEENARFAAIEYTPAVAGDREASLYKMRNAMLSRADLVAAVFIGGMAGIFDEYEMFKGFHPQARVLAVAGPGGAARQLAENRDDWDAQSDVDLDFSRVFYEGLGISPSARRVDNESALQVGRADDRPLQSEN